MAHARQAVLRALQLAASAAEPLGAASLSRLSRLLCVGQAQLVQAPAQCPPALAGRGAWRAVAAQRGRQLQPWRALSTAAGGEPAGEEGGDLTKAKFVRVLAFMMICAAGFRVAPWAMSSSVGHALGLLDAEEPFMLSSGISRLLLVARSSQRGRERAVEAGAVPKLLKLVDHEDEGVVDRALEALEALVESEAGLEALRAAGGQRVLQVYLNRAGKAPQNDGPEYRAQQLLLDLRRPVAAGLADGRGA